MNMFTPSDTPINRRQVFKIGGLTVSVAALVAACGSDVNGDTAPGRVGYAPPVTDPPEYSVDDAVLLRTASSLENTAIALYGAAGDLADLDAPTQALVSQLIDNHQATADEMAALTQAEGGVAWECTNPWLENRLVAPLVEAIQASDNPTRDILNVAVAFENLAASTHQVFSVQLTDPDAKSATLAAAMLASRHSAAIVVLTRGPDGYISPGLYGDGIPTDPDGVPYNYAVTDRFGSVGQAELIVGAADVNGKRTSFLLQTPAANSYIYNELEPSC